MKRRLLIPALCLLLLLAGCSQSKSYGGLEGGLMNGVDFVTNDSFAESGLESGLQDVTNQKWTVTVNISGEALNFPAAVQYVQTGVTEADGYLELEEINGDGTYANSRSAYLVARVPVDKYESFLAGIGDVLNVTHKSVDRDNVTLQYSDLVAHIDAVRVEQERLVDLLAKAETVGDLIQIEERLTSVRYELENYETSLRNLSNKIDYATIYVRITEVVRYSQAPANFFERAGEGIVENFGDTIEWILEAVLYLFTHIPAISLGIGFLFVIRFVIKRVKLPKIRKKKEGE